ncbi:MAG: hypothetical protein GKR97_11800 [Rhizobiaceae bacterium]|nr:hypothetical protein [Rhizobiaceae bacterium]
MTIARKDQIRALLKSIETGDPEPIAVVDEAKYIQHNPQTHEGSEGLVALFQRLAKTSPRVNIVRAFEDGDFVFAHTEYDFSTRRIGFEVFRFEDGRAVEHWDNIQPRLGPNSSGHSMVDGETASKELDRTESNRSYVRQFVEAVLIDGQPERLMEFIDGNSYVEHNPRLSDDLGELQTALQQVSDNERQVDYQTIHRILAEGNFVLCVCEGHFEGVHSAFYDLFRLENGKIVEHWDTREKIAPRSEWKNTNGKF